MIRSILPLIAVTDIESTFIIAITIIVAQILQYIKASKVTTKVEDIHQLVNGKYLDVIAKYADALNTISLVANKLAQITNDPKDIATAQIAQAKLEVDPSIKQVIPNPIAKP